MINLKSIDKRVQNTLLEKQRQLSEHNPIGGGNIFSRSVWQEYLLCSMVSWLVFLVIKTQPI